MSPIAELDIHTLQEKDLTLDPLTQDWSIYQLKKGHRFSADDIFTAYCAAFSGIQPTTLLDLGAGIGTVGLLTLSRFPHASLTMIEAQQISHQLAQKTLVHNQLLDRVQALHGDIRDTSLCNTQFFPLITGSPPYIPIGKGVMSPHPQRAACRMELRGSIFDYAHAAAQRLSPGGRFVVCFAAGDPRALQAIQEAGFFCTQRMDVIFRADLPPTISIFTCQKEPAEHTQHVCVTVRDSDGQWTEDYTKVRNFLPLSHQSV